MTKKLTALRFAFAGVFAVVLAFVAAPTSANAAVAGARPTVVNCGAGTHAVVRHPIVNGHRVRRVVCVRNTVVHRRAVATSGRRTTVNCGPGTHAVIHHPTVNGRRIRRVVCVNDKR